jgi:DNA-binding response OmpR family regulator
MTVLLVEDNPQVRMVLGLILEDEGYDVDTAANGVEALAKASRQPPQAIVLDLMLPVMSGWDFLAAWQCQPTSQGVPIVVISAGYRQEGRVPLDVHAFLAKPFELDELCRTVCQLVTKDEAARVAGLAAHGR